MMRQTIHHLHGAPIEVLAVGQTGWLTVPMDEQTRVLVFFPDPSAMRTLASALDVAADEWQRRLLVAAEGEVLRTR